MYRTGLLSEFQLIFPHLSNLIFPLNTNLQRRTVAVIKRHFEIPQAAAAVLCRVVQRRGGCRRCWCCKTCDYRYITSSDGGNNVPNCKPINIRNKSFTAPWCAKELMERLLQLDVIMDNLRWLAKTKLKYTL